MKHLGINIFLYQKVRCWALALSLLGFSPIPVGLKPNNEPTSEILEISEVLPPNN